MSTSRLRSSWRVLSSSETGTNTLRVDAPGDIFAARSSTRLRNCARRGRRQGLLLERRDGAVHLDPAAAVDDLDGLGEVDQAQPGFRSPLASGFLDRKSVV